MKLKKRIEVLGLLSLLLLTGCQKDKDEIEPQVVQPVNYSIPYSDTFSSASNVAIQYSNYIRAGYYDYAYDLINVPDDVLFDRGDLRTVEQSVSSVPTSWILYDVQPKTTYVQLFYGNKIGEAYDKKDNWLGDIVKETKSVAVPLGTSGSKQYMIGVDESYLSDEIVAVKLPDFVDVWVGDMLLSDKARDDNGYYLISNFVAGDTLTLRVNSDIESREIVLNLSGSADSKEDTTDGYTAYLTKAPTGAYAGGKEYNIRWETSRPTNDSAMEYLNNEGLQAIFTSICNQEEFYSGSYLMVMSENANIEALKPMYNKLADNFKATKTRTYTDLTMISAEAYTEDIMKRRGLAFEVIDRHSMRAWVTIKYSYVVTLKETGEQTVKSGTTEGEVGLSKDNGEWKMLYVSDKLLKGMI